MDLCAQWRDIEFLLYIKSFIKTLRRNTKFSPSSEHLLRLYSHKLR